MSTGFTSDEGSRVPKYPIGTLLLSNVPYYHGRNRDRQLGWIIHIYEKAISFTRVTVYMYVVEWNSSDRRSPAVYSETDIDCFVNNLKEI